jgi:tRNA(Ile)-lysidine synthase
MVFERILKTITRYNMFKPGDRVGVAVSGGADSVFLLHALFELAPRWDLKLCVLHLDHGLRGEESRGDAVFVGELARRLGLPAHLAATDVAQFKEDTRDNLEQAARRARRIYYQEIRKGENLGRIATGHTRLDQAETVLFRFLRGSGTAGLAAIRPVTSDSFVRPLIEVDRADIETYLREQGIVWREDSSNRSHEFARNRIRHQLLPELIRDWNPALVENLANTAQWAQDEEAYWTAEIERLAVKLVGRVPGRPDKILVKAKELCELPPAVARRLIRHAVERTKGDLLGISFQHVERILAMAAAPGGHDRMQAPGLDIYRSFDWIRLAPPGADGLVGRNFRMPVSVPGKFTLPDNSSTVGLELVKSDVQGLDGEMLSYGLELRNWRPGDQYRPVGRAAEEKIKIMFQEARIPLWERRNWPVLSLQDQIVWARLFGPAEDYAATSASRSVVRVWEE